jgi:hypothetical protein
MVLECHRSLVRWSGSVTGALCDGLGVSLKNGAYDVIHMRSRLCHMSLAVTLAMMYMNVLHEPGR